MEKKIKTFEEKRIELERILSREAKLKKFEEELAKALEMVNGYYAENWPTFREAIENLDTSPFKDYEEIKE